jgi:hypothetical protein
VITDEEVMRLFERADPARVEDTAPDVDATGYLATLRTRSSNVTLIDTEPASTGPKTGHRRVYITIAAAAAVVGAANRPPLHRSPRQLGVAAGSVVPTML